jgi:hypothetical protein
MKKPGAIFILIFAFANTFAQQAAVFKMKYLPGLIYTSTQTINSLTEIDFTGDKAELDKLPVSQLPIVLQNKSNLKYTVKTGGPNSQKKFSGIVQYLYAINKQLVNGNETAGIDTLKGKGFYGFFLNGAFCLDSAKNLQISDTLKNFVAATINSVKIIFPDKMLKPGDSFTQDVPLTMPVSGKPVTVNTHIVYKLTGIKNGAAFFDVTQTADFKTHTDQGDIEISGNGEGHIFYDMQYSFLKVYQNTLNLKFALKTDKLIMNGTSNQISVYQTDISAQ